MTFLKMLWRFSACLRFLAGCFSRSEFRKDNNRKCSAHVAFFPSPFCVLLVSLPSISGALTSYRLRASTTSTIKTTKQQ